MTAGSQASYGFRRHYMPCPVEIPDGSADERLIEESLYGGRCECRVIGEVRGPIWQLDARQLYSAAAAQVSVPVEYVGDDPCMELGCDLPTWAMNCVADVTLTTSSPTFPYRAYQERGRAKSAITVWPIGNFRTTLAGPEFYLAWESGLVDEVHDIHEYKTAPILKHWAAALWAERQRATAAMAPVVKRIALGLYGKFAQRQREWIVDPDDMPPAGVGVGDWYTMAADGVIVRHRVLDGKCMTERCEGFAAQSSPPISAWITSYARLMLWNFITTAGEVYYYDTDSVWVGRKGFDNLAAAGMIGPNLGDLKIAGEYERVVFRGIKDYECEAVRTKAGVPHHADQTGADTWSWDETTSFASHMANNEMPDGGTNRRRLRARREYRHGVVDADGSVRPHNLSNLGDAFNLSGLPL